MTSVRTSVHSPDKSTCVSVSYLRCGFFGNSPLKANEKDQASEALGKAYVWWTKYSILMDSMYEGMSMQRSEELEHWRIHDEAALKEYTNLGGKGISGKLAFCSVD